MIKRMRHRVFVDRVVQGALLRHMVRCWLASYATIGGLTFLGWMFIHPGMDAFVGPEAFMVEVMPMALVGIGAAVVVLPLYLWGLIRISHRFAGPVTRLKRVMQVAADGGPVDPVHFRNDDFWQELATAYNSLLLRLQSKNTATTSSPRSAELVPPLPLSPPMGVALDTTGDAWGTSGPLNLTFPTTTDPAAGR